MEKNSHEKTFKVKPHHFGKGKKIPCDVVLDFFFFFSNLQLRIYVQDCTGYVFVHVGLISIHVDSED
jgi:hypothetical protein